jgi:hypothetical protein
MRRHEPCKHVDFPCEYSIEELAEFQDHLGPLISLNHRRGRFTLRYLDNNPSPLFTTVYCPNQPLESYITDGVQIGSRSDYTYKKCDIEQFISYSISDMLRHAKGEAIHFRHESQLTRYHELDNVGMELIFKNFTEIMCSIPNKKRFNIEGF